MDHPMTSEPNNVRKNIILCSGPTCMRGGEKLKERVLMLRAAEEEN